MSRVTTRKSFPVSAPDLQSMQRSPTIEDLRRWLDLACVRFDFIDLREASIVHMISYGWAGWVAVIGHPDHASYEWVAQHDPEFAGIAVRRFESSNSGYGSAAAALRDGLIEMVD